MQTEKDLIQGCIEFDRSCQEAFYRKFADKMYGVCINYSKNEDDAADILQEAFITIFKKIHHFKHNGSLEGWVRRIVVNTAIDFWRKKQKDKSFIEEISNHIVESLEETVEKISNSEIVRQVNNLPEKASLVLKLYAIEGYTHQEISEIMDISVGTSKSQLSYARKLIKSNLKGLQD